MSSALTRVLRSEGFRLSAIFALAFALSVAAMGAVVLVMTEQAMRGQVEQYSSADIAAVEDGYRHLGLKEAHEVIGQRMAAPGGSDFFLLQRNGKAIAGNLPAMAPRTGPVTLPGSGPGHDVLGVGASLAPGLYVFSGSDLARIHATQRRLLITLLWLFSAGLILAVLGGALVSRSFLTRTDAMARACGAIMAGNLRARIPVRGSGDELDRLAVAINAMLDRIAALMENLRQVTNDIAHDLRTPVTHLRNRLERADEDGAQAADYRAALKAAIAKCDEILAQFAALLRIAQIEGGARRAGFAPVALDGVLIQMRDLYGAVAEESGHVLVMGRLDSATIRGDRELLVQLFSNLIENGLLHTPPGSKITLSLVDTPEAAVATVRDNGPGVPREEHAKLFQRLYRREASRTRPGYGLGLALVAAVADLHGARLRIADDGTPGLAVEIAFPR